MKTSPVQPEALQVNTETPLTVSIVSADTVPPIDIPEISQVITETIRVVPEVPPTDIEATPVEREALPEACPVTTTPKKIQNSRNRTPSTSSSITSPFDSFLDRNSRDRPRQNKCVEPSVKNNSPKVIRNDHHPPHSVNDQVLQRMRDIDTQMLSLQSKKMEIDEIILQKQREKMAIEQNVMQLQNERTELFAQMLEKSVPQSLVQPPTVSPSLSNNVIESEDEEPRLASHRRPATKSAADVLQRTKSDSVSSQTSSTNVRRIATMLTSESGDEQEIPTLPSNLDCPEYMQILKNPGRIRLKASFTDPELKSYDLNRPDSVISPPFSVHRSPIIQLKVNTSLIDMSLFVK